MLDKNWLIDRRIALMIKTMQADGHDFRVLYVQEPEGRWERTPMEVPTVAINLEPEQFAPIGDGLFPTPPHVNEVVQRGRTDPRRKRSQDNLIRSEMLAPGPGRLRRGALLSLRAPEVAIELLPHLSMPAILRAPLGLFYSLLSAVSKLGQATRAPADFLSDPVRSAAGVPLHYWDKSVVRYAEQIWRPDMVVANDFPTLRAALEIKRRIRCPVILDAHELYSYQPNVPHNTAKQIFREERVLVRHLDGLILINQEHRKVVQRDSPFRGKTALCPNATTQPEGFDIRVRYDRIREKAPIPDDHKIMLFQGGINRARRIDFLLQGLAQAKSRKVHQVFLTFGQEVEEFKKHAQDLGISGRVHFLPFVPWDDVLFWAASADCGVMPYQATDQNTAISSPNKMYEFIAAGTPMIGSSDLVNVNKIISEEGFGVSIPLRTVADYANAIDLMFDEALGGPERFRSNLIDKHQKYLWQNEVSGAVELYRGVISRHRKARLRR
ncbi:MAG: glycosyltransferase [Acidobacteria bacterium]|nr:glycosyltransferase [Acidobacteriota bacterium]